MVHRAPSLANHPIPAASIAPETASIMSPTKTTNWPSKVNLFGVDISVTNYDQLVRAILDSAHAHLPAIVSLFSVHSLISASDDADLCAKANSFQAIGPDGQPVRWAMNWLHKTKLSDRVYGPETTLRICQAAADEGVSIYLYGSTEQVLEKLSQNLRQKYPKLQIVGCESPPFRSLTQKESNAMVDRVNESGAGIFFIGLGCPKQDLFAYEYRDRLRCVQVAVGAAFDFHAGTKRTAPPWMQKRGLEWLFRLFEEPGRLWKRYLVTNSRYLMKLGYVCVFGQAAK